MTQEVVELREGKFHVLSLGGLGSACDEGRKLGK